MGLIDRVLKIDAAFQPANTLYYPVPIKASSYVGVIIVDNKTKEVAFFRRSFLPENDPLDKAGLNKQLEKIFKGYFDKEEPS